MQHTEENCVRLLNRSGIVKVYANKVVINKKAMAQRPIGIRRWGRIDFLVNHCNYIVVYDDGVVAEVPKEDTQKERVRTSKGENNKGEHKVKKMRKF